MNEFITIGVITASFGCRGEVKVYLYSNFPQRFIALNRVFIDLSGKVFERKVENVKLQKNRVIVKLEDINTPEEAKKLRGALLQIPPEEVWPLPDGHFYIFQLIGLPVFTEEKCYVGRVADVLPTKSNDVYVVKDEKKGKDYLIPAIKEVVKKIDLDESYILIRPLPGMLEE